MLRQYAVYTQDPQFLEFISQFIRQYNLRCEMHLNRARVLVPSQSTIHTEFLLRFPQAEDLGTWRE